MTYPEALEKIHSRQRYGSKLGLRRITRLCDRIDNPQNKLRIIHVAGTNGKGSTCTMIAGILHAAGYKTGLYTSPYLEDFCERIQIDAHPIGHEALARQVESLWPIVEDLQQKGDPATEFECITALAFDWFWREKCDFVVLETGIGGLYDATNVIAKPIVSVITSVGMDHVELLGDTMTAIAAQKCGIMKQGGVTVSAPDQPGEALAEIMRQAAGKGNQLCMGNQNALMIEEETIMGSRVRLDGLALTIPFAGRHQHANAVTAVEAAHALRARGIAIPDEAIREGIAAARLPARIEALSHDPLLILDGAHNPAGIAALCETLRATCPGQAVYAVVGMLAEKDSAAALALLAPLCRTIWCVTPPGPRALPARELCKTASAAGCEAHAYGDDYTGAVTEVLKAAGAKGVALICGSLYLAGTIRQTARRIAERWQRES